MTIEEFNKLDKGSLLYNRVLGCYILCLNKPKRKGNKHIIVDCYYQKEIVKQCEWTIKMTDVISY